MFRNVLWFLLLCLVLCCSNQNISEKPYVGYLKANDSIDIPFNFLLKDFEINISNSKENVSLEIVLRPGDSSKIISYIFEDYIIFKNDNDTLKGFYYNESLSRRIPFFAFPSSNRFISKNKEDFDNFNGNWRVIFDHDNKASFDSQMMIDQFKNEISGTVRTETGDYGFMQGIIRGNRFSMSNFNGYRGYMMDGYLKNDTIKGYLYMGNYDSKPFMAFKDKYFNLSDPYGLTKIRDGYDDFVFSFENTKGELVSNTDKKFDNKIVLVQLMGSWCPNCLDESRYLSTLSEKFDNIKFVSIAFEYAKNKKLALNNLNKLKKLLNIDYDILLAQYGTSDKFEAAGKLISIDTIISYPTLIVIDKNKKVRRIHTGFNGPATGRKYDDFKAEFEGFIELLNNE